jgi:putative ABC transport system permease protein
MYAIEHALLNLGKNKGRNILLGIIIFVIITATVVALAIFNTTGVVIEETRAAIMSAVRITPTQRTQSIGSGQQAVMSGGGQQESLLTLELHQYFAESPYITGADISESGRGIEAVYYLIHPDMHSAFEADLRSRGLPDSYAVRADDTAFASVIGSVESLQSLSFTFLLIILVLGAVIMILLSAIAIRERKYEIGVLRAMGMKKNKIALGLWTEIIVITCICFVFGMGAGTIASQPISDAILAGQNQTLGTGATTLADRLNESSQPETVAVNISVNTVTALQIFGISILLATIAGIISVSRITKSEPIKILMERT